ncbi:outer membrane beta-barrel protein [Aeromonas sp. DNP9]|uniref:outer membrane protein n=1 Tax=Aeromonas sp. DNP9 TaxID=1535548 RepID=UPI00084A4E57|nr:outer membrane beta-barrel protein [Aeromonas sp. DNP9]
MKLHIPLIFISAAVFQQAAHADGYYVSGKFIDSTQYASSMDTTLRVGIDPRNASYTEVVSKDDDKRGSVALGYQFDKYWQIELEYNPKTDSHFITSIDGGSFNGSRNNYQISTERLMINAYREVPVYGSWSVYGQAGLGLSKIDVEGWQGNEGKRFDSNEQSNLAYSIGAGLRANISSSFIADFGYRYIGLGKVESGFNRFDNARHQSDEQLKAELSLQEIYLSLTYLF